MLMKKRNGFTITKTFIYILNKLLIILFIPVFIQSSTPLIMSFELPVMAPGRTAPDNDTQYVKDIEQLYNIQVIFSTRPKLHSSLVLVKGSEKESAKVQEATQLLINFMCENIAVNIFILYTTICAITVFLL